MQYCLLILGKRRYFKQENMYIYPKFASICFASTWTLATRGPEQGKQEQFITLLKYCQHSIVTRNLSLCTLFKPLNQLQKRKGRKKQPEPMHIKTTFVDMNLQNTIEVRLSGSPAAAEYLHVCPRSAQPKTTHFTVLRSQWKDANLHGGTKVLFWWQDWNTSQEIFCTVLSNPYFS